MRKIGILGGTFNPIHNGHLKLAENALNELNLDEIMFIPSGVSYLKKDIAMPTKEVRFEMTSLAMDLNSKFTISDIEINREGNSYTYETLIQLRKQLPDCELYYIVGADSLFNMSKWMNPTVIFNNCIVVVEARDEYGIDEINNTREELIQKFNARVIVLTAPKFEASSSVIRKMIHNGDNVRNLLPTKVLEYIKSNNLYKD